MRFMDIILDAAALLNNESFVFEKGKKYFTTSLVFSEWRDFRSKSLAENSLSSGALTIQDPCPLSIQKTIFECEKSGTRLGEADISVVALAAEFKSRGGKFSVITDDYSVQNVLKKMGVGFFGVVQGQIKKHRVFGKRKK